MNETDRHIKRLFQRARETQSESPAPPPWGFAKRVVRQWRSEAVQSGAAGIWLRLSQRGLTCACLLLLLSLFANRNFWNRDAFQPFPEPLSITELVLAQ